MEKRQHQRIRGSTTMRYINSHYITSAFYGITPSFRLQYRGIFGSDISCITSKQTHSERQLNRERIITRLTRISCS